MLPGYAARLERRNWSRAIHLYFPEFVPEIVSKVESDPGITSRSPPPDLPDCTAVQLSVDRDDCVRLVPGR